MDILFGICQVGQGREAPLKEPGMKEAAWMQHPLSAALGTDTRKVFDTGGQTEIALNVTLLIEIDRPFHCSLKQNKTKLLTGKADQTWVCMPHSCYSGGIPEDTLLSVFLPFLLFNLVKLSRATD